MDKKTISFQGMRLSKDLDKQPEEEEKVNFN